jgi:hypothetical protein
VSGTDVQANNIAVKFKKSLNLKKAHKLGLVSAKQLAKLKQKEMEK